MTFGRSADAVRGRCPRADRSRRAERDGTAFRCRYEIGWPEGAAARTAAGVDAVQALVLALKLVGTELYTSEAHAGGRLRWERECGGYGFPVPGTIRDLLVGDDARFEG